jgi:hypothetical protein
VTLHELATNAANYGALSVTDGHVRVEWSHEQNGRLAKFMQMCQVLRMENKLPFPDAGISPRQWCNPTLRTGSCPCGDAELDQTVSAMIGNKIRRSLRNNLACQVVFDRLFLNRWAELVLYYREAILHVSSV